MERRIDHEKGAGSSLHPSARRQLVLGTGVDRPTHQPLIDPHEVPEYLPLPASIQNILLLGIDKSDASAARGQDYHIDAILVVVVNFDKNEVDLLSLPRDTLIYVPRIKGIYKLNAAINCGGGKIEEGFHKICEETSWMLGGLKMYY